MLETPSLRGLPSPAEARWALSMPPLAGFTGPSSTWWLNTLFRRAGVVIDNHNIHKLGNKSNWQWNSHFPKMSFQKDIGDFLVRSWKTEACQERYWGIFIFCGERLDTGWSPKCLSIGKILWFQASCIFNWKQFRMSTNDLSVSLSVGEAKLTSCHNKTRMHPQNKTCWSCTISLTVLRSCNDRD